VELSSRQRSAVFAAVVIALAALGYWLVVPKVTHAGGRGRAGVSPTPAASAPATQAPPPSATATPSATGAVNIYAWLPFTEQDLADAAAVTVKFAEDYDTYSDTDSADAYVGRMNGLITEQLATTLRGVYSTPGVAELRTSQKQASTGTAAIDSLRAFGPSSLTFVVTAKQHLVTSRGTSNGSTQYAVTVTGSGGSWQVSDIQLASAGNS
jgi:hypothetical protein